MPMVPPLTTSEEHDLSFIHPLLSLFCHFFIYVHFLYMVYYQELLFSQVEATSSVDSRNQKKAEQRNTRIRNFFKETHTHTNVHAYIYTHTNTLYYYLHISSSVIILHFRTIRHYHLSVLYLPFFLYTYSETHTEHATRNIFISWLFYLTMRECLFGSTCSYLFLF